MPAGPRACAALRLCQGPDDDVLAGGEMQQWGVVGHLDRRHRVQVDPGVGRLERPRGVMDLGAADPALVLGVEAVALRQKMLERPGICVEDGAVRAVGRAESFAGVATAVVEELVAAAPD